MAATVFLLLKMNAFLECFNWKVVLSKKTAQRISVDPGVVTEISGVKSKISELEDRLVGLRSGRQSVSAPVLRYYVRGLVVIIVRLRRF